MATFAEKFSYMDTIFSMSKEGKSEYCCNVIRIGQILPIPGKDLIGQTLVNGESIVIRKDQVKEGDVLLYAGNETQLSPAFLKANCLYSEPSMNADKDRKGYFGKNGRVRMIRLGGVQSMGYLFTKAELAAWCPAAGDAVLEEHIGEDFDTVYGNLLVRAYVPPVRKKERMADDKDRRKTVKKFDRFLSESRFEFHYETRPLAKNLERLEPDSRIDVTVKVHGTSVIISRIPVRVPLKVGLKGKILNAFIKWTGLLKKYAVPEFKTEYGVVYSSRNVIKNRYINPNSDPGGYYGQDIWSEFGELLADYVYPGMTVYGEIAGYLSGVQQGIQKDYDYGCEMGKNVLMPYRITTEDLTEAGLKVRREWEVEEVMQWVRMVRLAAPASVRERLMPMTVLYSGPVRNMYEGIDFEADIWRDEFLARMKGDTKRLGLERSEPLCLHHRVPREGVCIRIRQDSYAECFKLKALAFLDKEAREIDAGNVDMEMAEGV